jgi:hypothetical protein
MCCVLRQTIRETIVLAVYAGHTEKSAIVTFAATAFDRAPSQVAKYIIPSKVAEGDWVMSIGQDGTHLALCEKGTALARDLVETWGTAGLDAILQEHGVTGVPGPPPAEAALAEAPAVEAEVEATAPATPRTTSSPADLVAASTLAATARAIMARVAAVAPTAWIDAALRDVQEKSELVTLARVLALQEEAKEREARGEFVARDLADRLAAYEAAELALCDAVAKHTAKRPRQL